MGRVLTNNISLSYSIESALGTAGTDWFLLEPNGISQWGATIVTTPRTPISKNRQRRKGAVTDLDSAVEFEHDITLSAFMDFIEGFVFVTGVNMDMILYPDGPSADGASNVDGTNDEFEFGATFSTAVANKLNFSTDEYATLVYARGFTNSANNGLKQLDANVTTSDQAIGVSDTALVDETSPVNARVELAGLRSLASAADFTWDWDAGTSTATLTSAGDISDFSTFGLTAGQFVHIGSPDGSGGVTNAFENSVANDMYGYARVKSFGSGTIVFDKVDAALQFDDAVAPSTAVDIMFGTFFRNVSVDDSAYLERSFHFELEQPNLGASSTDMYEYAAGNYCNSAAFNLPLTSKATVTFGFTGTDTTAPVASASRKSGASSAEEPNQTAAFSTTSDVARMRITDVDESGLSTDFKSLTVTLGNNVTPEKVIGTLGASYMNTGLFTVDVQAQLVFTNSTVIDRVRANTTVTMDWVINNDDGAIAVDIPSMTLGNGAREYPVNESVLVNLTGEAFGDATLGTSIGVSVFPYAP